MYATPLQRRDLRPIQKIYRGEKLRLRETLKQDLQHLLGIALHDQPVVNDGDTYALPPLLEAF
jgi:hypothetical protein